MHLEITDAEHRMLVIAVAAYNGYIYQSIADELAEPDRCAEIIALLETDQAACAQLYTRLRNLSSIEGQP